MTIEWQIESVLAENAGIATANALRKIAEIMDGKQEAKK